MVVFGPRRMKLILRQKVWLGIVATANVLLWAIPSDVVELIARDEHTLLGRYSRPHFTANVIVLFLSAISLWIEAAEGEKYRRRWFAVIAAALAIAPALLLADFLLRGADRAHYVQDTLAYHRPANFELTAGERIEQADLEEGALGVMFRDAPQALRSYPDAPPGYPPIEIRYHADRRGFRNAADAAQYDIVALGDSFTEGSKVSDEHPWPVRLAEFSGLSVYNLGMSGYAPIHYLASLREYGLPLQPKIVLCMLYEGNDFRSTKADAKAMKPALSNRVKRYVKQSPLLGAIDGFLVDTFAPLRCHTPPGPAPAIDWLPLAVPEGAGAKHYAFEPKQMIALLVTSMEFAHDRHWLNPRDNLSAMKQLCDEGGARIIVVYAPLKAHVVLPLVLDRLAAENLHAFCALREDELPDPAALKNHLAESIDDTESVVSSWCGAQGIAFVSLTAPLRAATAAGVQTYFTYDQHWTPEGHAVAANAIEESSALEVLDRLDTPIRQAEAADER